MLKARAKIRGSHKTHTSANVLPPRWARRPVRLTGLAVLGAAVVLAGACTPTLLSGDADGADLPLGGSGGDHHTEPATGGTSNAAGGTSPIGPGGNGPGGQGGQGGAPSTECEPGFAISKGKCIQCDPGEYCSGTEPPAACADSWDDDNDPASPCAAATIQPGDCAASYDYEPASGAHDAYCVRDGWTMRWSVPISYTDTSAEVDPSTLSIWQVKFHSTGEVLTLGRRDAGYTLIRVSAETGSFEWELPIGEDLSMVCDYAEAPDHNLLIACAPRSGGIKLLKATWPAGEIAWDVQHDVEGDIRQIAFDGSAAAIVKTVSGKAVTAHQISWTDGSLVESAPGELPSALTAAEEDAFNELAYVHVKKSVDWVEPFYVERGTTTEAQGVIGTPDHGQMGVLYRAGLFWTANLTNRHLDIHNCLNEAPSADWSDFGPEGQFVEKSRFYDYPYLTSVTLALYLPNPK